MYVFSISIWSYKTPTNRTSTKHICWKGGGKRARGMLNRKLIIRLTTKTTTKRLFIIKHIMSPKVSKVFFVNLKVKHNCLRLTIQQLISLKKRGGLSATAIKLYIFLIRYLFLVFPTNKKKTPRDERKLVAVVLWNVITKYGSGNYRDDFLLFQLFSNDTTILYYFFE